MKEVTMWWDWNTWGGWWAGMTVMMILMVAFWGGIIALIAWAIVRLTRREPPGGITERYTPLDIARERYAKGEITKDEFDRIKRDLS
jgi:putative membrane protein